MSHILSVNMNECERPCRNNFYLFLSEGTYCHKFRSSTLRAVESDLDTLSVGIYVAPLAHASVLNFRRFRPVFSTSMRLEDPLFWFLTPTTTTQTTLLCLNPIIPVCITLFRSNIIGLLVKHRRRLQLTFSRLQTLLYFSRPFCFFSCYSSSSSNRNVQLISCVSADGSTTYPWTN